MANQEMETILDLDTETLRKHNSKCVFYYSQSDGWGPISHYHRIKDLFPNGKVFLCEDDTPHSFVLSHSQLIAERMYRSGGREHAMATALSKSPITSQIFVCPGNPGTSTVPKTQNVDSVDYVSVAQSNNVSVVIVGPEVPLVNGIEAEFRKEGIPVFGPSREAAQMEGSKAFAKEFMKKHNIPTAAYKTCKSIKEAIEYMGKVSHAVVIKASGLAAGKGVLIPSHPPNLNQVETFLKELPSDSVEEIVIEELLLGYEISVLCVSDGYSIAVFPPAMDHKTIGENDTGSNTGGMGVVCPVPIGARLSQEIKESVLLPSIEGMRKDGFPFLGCLFVGLMITKDGPKVLEYNVRFGDPETQAVLPLMKSDFAELVMTTVERRLDAHKLEFYDKASCVVMASSEGYPGVYKKRDAITLPKSLKKDVWLYQSGTLLTESGLVTHGGRVLCVSAMATTLQEAIHNAYAEMDKVDYRGKYVRSDIGQKVLNLFSKPKDAYAEAGVSIDEGNRLVDLIKPIVKQTRRSGTDSDIGGFGSLFDLKACGYKDPILVSATDGVGTKLHIAQSLGLHKTIGIDLVAMNVNDLVVQGAEPLFFLDYYACGQLNASVAKDVIEGIANGCIESGCALVGGETAEMAGMYKKGEYDLAGFVVGAVERDHIIPSESNPVVVGDALIGIPSSGIHSNGFSLVRRIISDAGVSYSAACPWNESKTLGEAVLEPTRIYVKGLLPVVRSGRVKALSHITGGGFYDNVPRVLPKDVTAQIDLSTWNMPAVFKWLKENGKVEAKEMGRIFNCGMGMVVVVGKNNVEKVLSDLKAAFGQGVVVIGNITERKEKQVVLENLHSWK